FSHWRLLEAGGTDRLTQLDALLGKDAHPRERARCQIDLALVSVLLAGCAGPQWHYTESATRSHFAGAEGLAVAAFHAFTSGLFSSDPTQPLQVDATGLRALSPQRLGAALQ